MKKIIEVIKCSTDECPYCLPHDSNNSINYCGAYNNPQEVNAQIKTFPNLCPLENAPLTHHSSREANQCGCHEGAYWISHSARHCGNCGGLLPPA